jgi:uncharacterized protein YggE
MNKKEEQRMKWMIVAIGVALAVQAGAQEAIERRLTVSGEGSVASVPDMATITLGVTHEARTAGEALGLTSAATAQVLARLGASGIEPRDMQTNEVALSPVWDNRSSNTQRPQIVGFEASNTITVRVRALGSLGTILDDVVKDGANTFRGLSFGLQNPDPIRDEARRRAVAEAMRKAQLYADAAGLTLGPVLQLSEGGGYVEPIMMERMAMAAPVPIAEGEVSTGATVNMVFSIGQ